MSCDQDQDNQDVETMEEANNWPPQVPLTVSGDKNKKKPGIIYLSSIPPGFNVSCTIAFFSQFGKVGRVFLQPGIWYHIKQVFATELISVWEKNSQFLEETISLDKFNW